MKMRQYARVLLVAFAMVAGACSKDSERMLQVTTERYSGGPKLVLDSDNYAVWQHGDEVRVNDANRAVSVSEGRAQLSVEGVSGSSYCAYYPASAVKSYADGAFNVILPNVQLYDTNGAGQQIVEAPMAARSIGNELCFHNICGLLAVSVPAGSEVVSITVKASGGKALSGRASVTFDGQGIPQLRFTANQDSVRDSAMLYFSAFGHRVRAGSNVFYVAVAPVSATNFSVKVRYNNGLEQNVHTVAQTGGTNAIGRSQIGPVGVAQLSGSSTGVNVGALVQRFRIAEDRYAYFAAGNLQYAATGSHAVAGGGSADGTWTLAAHQHDYVGSGNSRIASDYAGVIDLFGWATGGFHDSRDDDNRFYLPYSTSSSTDYDNTNNPTGYGPSNNQEGRRNLTGESANYDWGVYNAIANGGNEPGRWRVFTSAELQYVLPNPNEPLAAVEGVKCLCVKPQGFKLPLDAANVGEGGSYSLREARKLEANGMAFFPCGGRRVGAAYDWGNVSGSYWTVTRYDTDKAQYLSVSANGAEVLRVERHHGFAVRLMHDAR